MRINQALLLVVLGFSLAAPLGPVNMEMIKQALSKRKGWFFSILTGIGAMSGDFIIAFTSMTLGQEFLRAIISIFAVKIFLYGMNVFILTFIGISGLKTKIEEEKITQKISEEDKQANAINRSILQYGKGFLIVITSPWSYLWWLSFGSYLLASGIALRTIIDRLIATILFLAGILLWVLLFSGSLGFSRKIASPKVLTIITKTSASIILLFALKIAYDLFLEIINHV